MVVCWPNFSLSVLNPLVLLFGFLLSGFSYDTPDKVCSQKLAFFKAPSISFPKQLTLSINGSYEFKVGPAKLALVRNESTSKNVPVVGRKTPLNLVCLRLKIRKKWFDGKSLSSSVLKRWLGTWDLKFDNTYYTYWFENGIDGRDCLFVGLLSLTCGFICLAGLFCVSMRSSSVKTHLLNIFINSSSLHFDSK